MRTKILKPKSPASHPRSSEKGYLLLAVMLLITIMMIMLAIEAPRISQQIKREKEDELVFRGKEYATAIKRFYHKNGTYPLSIEQLEDTNHMRFLRKRYKDPMTTSGEWKFIHVGEAQFNIPAPTLGTPGQAGTLGTSTPGGAATPSASPTPGGFGGGANLGPGGAGLGGGLGTGLGGGTQPAPGGQMGTLTTQNIGSGISGSSVGGGPIMGVASTSKKTSIKEFNGNNEYDEWLFVYDPRMEASAGGVIIAAPRTGAAPPPGAPGATPSGSPGSPSPGPVASPTPQGVSQ